MNPPGTAEQTRTAPEAISLTEVVGRARQAADYWGSLAPKVRAKVLLDYRSRLVNHLDDIVTTVGREVFKPRLDVVNEVLQACALIGYYARKGPRMLQRQRVGTGLLLNKAAEYEYRPLGVVGIITPWNYPALLVLSPLIQALMAGNAVILKPSEKAQATAELLHSIFQQLNVPADLFQLVPGGPEAAIALAESGVDKIAFTGGTRGGKAVMQAAAKNMTPVLLELGGNDPMIVTDEADLDRAANGAIWGAFLNVGQSCIAVERCYVARSVAKPFIEKVTQLTKKLKQGLPQHSTSPEDYDLGALVSSQQYLHVHALVRDALEKGAKLEVGGVDSIPDNLEDPANRCFPPTVLSNVDHRMRLMREETFGPVLPIMTYDEDSQAIALANDSDFGLAASVWCKNRKRAKAIAEQLNAGGVVINDCLVHFAVNALPFGGMKQSGIGRTHGMHGLQEFCTIKSITTHRFGPRLEIQWFPYGQKHRWFAKAIRLLFRCRR